MHGPLHTVPKNNFRMEHSLPCKSQMKPHRFRRKGRVCRENVSNHDLDPGRR